MGVNLRGFSMIKKITLILLGILCCHTVVEAQFTALLVQGPTESYEGLESANKTKYLIRLTGTMPAKYVFTPNVVGGTVTASNLTPTNMSSILYVQVKWDCAAPNGSVSITVDQKGYPSVTSNTVNVYIKSFLNYPNDYCSQTVNAKQNLHYGQTPDPLSVTYCDQTCLNGYNAMYQWQMGDVPIGTFPQVPTSWTDIPFPILPGHPPNQPNSPIYQPFSSTYDNIKAYRRKTFFTYQGFSYAFYSAPAVISTFDVLAAGHITWTGFGNGVPAFTQSPATGGLCDGFNYVYTWESSTDNTNWTTVGMGVTYPSTGQLTASCYMRRRVDCNGETLYTNIENVIVTTLNAGSISGGGTVAFNSIPAVTQVPASGGICGAPNYGYTWERSINNGPWLSFGTGAGYPPNIPIVASCKIRRKVHCVYEDAYTLEISFTISPYVSPNTENRNYVRVDDIAIPYVANWEQADALATGDKLQTTTYLDDYGRSIQSVVKQGSFISGTVGQDPNLVANYQDLVSHISYDGVGRQDKEFLPYATISNLGFFKTNAAAEQQSFTNQKYNEPNGSAYTFSRTTFDGSPLDRVVIVKQEGAAINGDAGYLGVTSDYGLYNTAGEYVVNWDFNYASGLPEVSSIPYADKSLLKSITKDEKGKLMVTYSDFSGRVILKRVQEAATVADNSYAGWLNTYYVYDDLGRLRYTITPKAVAAMFGTGGSWVVDADTKKGLCFYQEYDGRGRVVVRHSPDGGEVWLVYDNRDRLVLSQDENQRNRGNVAPRLNQWSFSLYDENDRVVTTGLVNESRARVAMQDYVNGLNPQNQQVQIYTGSNETITAYNPVTVNLSGNTFINAANYYDDYTHKPSNHNNANLGVSDFATTDDADVEAPDVSFFRLKGARTVSKTRVLDAGYDDNNSGNDQFLSTTTYFDDKGRIVQSYSDNVKNGVDAAAVLYDFAGKVVSARSRHSMPNNDFDGLVVVTKNDYDLLGRPSGLWKLYTKNSADIHPVSIANSRYKKLDGIILDEFGRVKTKTVGDDPQNSGSPLETMDYSYNIQGRFTGVNKDYALAAAVGNMTNQWTRKFGFYLGYENGDNVFAGKQYNGNITGVVWRSQGDNIQRKYDYIYDNINRFRSAAFVQKDAGISGTWGTAQVDVSASISDYDGNGNIQGMLQKGIVPGTNGGITLDDMHYYYYNKSNRLKEITDINNNYTGKQGDFKDYDDVGNNKDYDYDFNGNIRYDKNKNIIGAGSNQASTNPNDGIVSNFLDLPQTITINGKSITEYTYDAGGNKLAKKVTQLTSPPSTVTTWYVGAFVYEETSTKTELQYILNEEGKLRIMDPVTPQWVDAANFLEIDGNVEFDNTGTTQHKWGVWDYYLKDNLQNTRMVLTEERHLQQLSCGMELSNYLDEERTFGNSGSNEVAATRDVTPSLWSNNTSARVSKLLNLGSGVQGSIGPNAMLKVMAGDVVTGSAKFYYHINGTTQNAGIANNIVNSLLTALGASGYSSTLIKDNINLANPASASGDVNSFILGHQNQGGTNTMPRAFINYVFFDEQFRYEPSSSSAEMIYDNAVSGNERQGGTPIIPHKASKNGYVYIYLSNETQNIPVYFDDINITYVPAAITEDNAYYPFGLKIQGLSAKALGKPKAKQGYQGAYSEQDDETGYDEFDLRSYDPQVGRWIQVDPKDEFVNGYSGMGENPINNIDVDGGGTEGMSLFNRTLVGTVAGALVGTGVAAVMGKEDDEAWKYIGYGALLGGGLTYLSSSPTAINVQFVPNWDQVKKDADAHRSLFRSAYFAAKLRSIVNEVFSLGKIVTITGDGFQAGEKYDGGKVTEGTLTTNLVKYFKNHPNAKSIKNAITEFHSGVMGYCRNDAPKQFAGIRQYFNSGSTFLYGNCFQAREAESTSEFLNGATVIGSETQQLDLPYLLAGHLSGNPELANQQIVVGPKQPLSSNFLQHKVAKDGKIEYSGRAVTKISFGGRISYQRVSEGQAREMNDIYHRIGGSVIKNIISIITRGF